MTRLEKLQNIGLNSDETAMVLIYSDHGLLWINNTNVLHHQKEMDKFIDNIVSKPRKQINEFVTIVKDNYVAHEEVDVENETLFEDGMELMWYKMFMINKCQNCPY